MENVESQNTEMLLTNVYTVYLNYDLKTVTRKHLNNDLEYFVLYSMEVHVTVFVSSTFWSGIFL